MAKKKTKKGSKGKKKAVKKTSGKKTKKVAKQTKSQKKEEQKGFDETLRNILLISGIIIIVIAISVFSNSQPRNFEYRGVNYNVVEFCDAGPPCLITYNAKLPIIQDGQKGNYNFYLRHDPRVLDERVPFEGDLVLKDDLNLNITYNRNCEGYSSIAVQNLATLIGVSGINLTQGEDQISACDPTGQEMYIMIQEGNKTEIEQIGPACYNININRCEILDGTERFMNEMFVELEKVVER